MKVVEGCGENVDTIRPVHSQSSSVDVGPSSSTSPDRKSIDKNRIR